MGKAIHLGQERGVWTREDLVITTKIFFGTQVGGGVGGADVCACTLLLWRIKLAMGTSALTGCAPRTRPHLRIFGECSRATTPRACRASTSSRAPSRRSSAWALSTWTSSTRTGA